jgi:hypothetical protein
MARTGRVYVLRDPDGNMVYAGSTEDPHRLTRHRGQCKSDGLASPLYRYANELARGLLGRGLRLRMCKSSRSGMTTGRCCSKCNVMVMRWRGQDGMP